MINPSEKHIDMQKIYGIKIAQLITKGERKMSEYKSPLKAAICEFKKKGIVIKKESANPFFKSKYADLPTILDAIEIEAAKCGLVITSQLIAGEAIVLTTTLSHKDSDESIISTFPVFGSKPQEIGSSISYARRYNIQSLLNLAAEDDDGNAAQEGKPTSKQVYGTAAAMKKKFAEIVDEIEGSLTHEALKETWKRNNTHILAMKSMEMGGEEMFAELEKYKNERKAKITEEEAHNAAYGVKQ